MPLNVVNGVPKSGMKYKVNAGEGRGSDNPNDVLKAMYESWSDMQD